VNTFSFYPNPTFDELFYSFDSNIAEDIKVEITDMLGRLVISKMYQSTIGSNTVKIDLNSLIAGSYNIKSIGINSGIIHITVIVKQ